LARKCSESIFGFFNRIGQDQSVSVAAQIGGKRSIYGEQGTMYIGIDNVTVQCIAPLGRHAWCGGAPPL
jgi:hypothetical protein